MAYSDTTIDAGFLDGAAAPPRYANFGPRLGAALLDFLILIPVTGIAYYFSALHPNFTIYLCIFAIAALYKPVMEGLYGATLGKMILKLKVLTKEGTPITMVQAFMRWIPWALGAAASLYVVYNMFQIPGYTDIDGFQENTEFMMEYQKENGVNWTDSLISSLGFILPLVSALVMLGGNKRMAAHDILAETVVIHTQPKIAAI